MSGAQGNILILIAFAALLVWVNSRCTRSHWSGLLLRWVTFILLFFVLAETTFLIDGLVR